MEYLEKSGKDVQTFRQLLSTTPASSQEQSGGSEREYLLMFLMRTCDHLEVSGAAPTSPDSGCYSSPTTAPDNNVLNRDDDTEMREEEETRNIAEDVFNSLLGQDQDQFCSVKCNPVIISGDLEPELPGVSGDNVPLYMRGAPPTLHHTTPSPVTPQAQGKIKL